MGGPTSDREPARPVESLVETWAAELRTAESVARRSRTRSLRRQAAEESNLRTALADLADAGTPVALGLSTGGRVVGVAGRPGVDFVPLRSETGQVLVRLDAVTTVQAAGSEGLPWPAGRREVEVGGAQLSFAGALADLADEGRPVRLDLAGGASVTAEIEVVGEDLAVVRKPEGDDMYLSLQAISAAWV